MASVPEHSALKFKVKIKSNRSSRYKSKSFYSQLEAIPFHCNNNLTSPSNEFMRKLMGEPRKNKDYGSEDSGLDNLELSRHHTTDDVGPFKVSGLRLAVESLKNIMMEIKNEYPNIYMVLGSAGMRSVRLQRGTNKNKAISNHAWGAAIDLKIDGLLDP